MTTTRHPTNDDLIDRVRPRRRRSRTVVTGAVAGLLATFGPALAVVGHGPSARAAALGLALAGIVAASLITLATQRSAAAVVVASSALALPLLTSGTLGRAPGVVAAISIVAAVLALHGPGRLVPAERRGAMLAIVPLLLVLQVSWLVWGSVLTVALVAGAICAIIVIELRSPETTRRWEDPARRTAAELGERLSVLVGRVTARAGTGTAGSGGKGPRGVHDPVTWAYAAAVAGSVALTAPLFTRIVQNPEDPVFGVTDFAFHLDLARAMQLWPLELTMPHPVFHLAVRATDPLVGFTASPVLVLCAACAVIAAALVRLGLQPAHDRPPLGPAAAAAFSVLWFVSDSPTLLLQTIGIAEPAPFAPVHLWGNPTETVALATVVVLVPLVAALVRATIDDVATRGLRWAVAAAAVMSTLAKPAMVLVLAPATVVYLLVTRRWSLRTVGVLTAWFLVPAGVIVAWQTWFLETGQSPELTTGFTIEPLALLEVYGWTSGGLAFWVAALVPLGAVVVGRRRFASETSVALTLIALGISFVPLLLMQETGERALHGNLAKSGYYAWAMLWILSARFWVLELRDTWSTREPSRPPVRAAAIAAAMAVVVVSGTLAHLDAAGAITLADAWSGR